MIGIHPKKIEINSKVSDVSDLSSTNFCRFFGQDEYFELELNTIANWPFSEDIHWTPEAYDEPHQLVSLPSLLAFVWLHNAPDELLNDLLKQDQLIYADQTVSLWAFEETVWRFLLKVSVQQTVQWERWDDLVELSLTFKWPYERFTSWHVKICCRRT